MAIALNNKKDYYKALDLLKPHCKSSFLINMLSKGPTTYNKIRLLRELKSLDTNCPKEISVSEAPKPPVGKPKGRLPTQKHQAVNARKPIYFYPSELHPAYKRQTYLYKVMNNLHPQLDTFKVTDRSKACQSIVRASDEIKSIYELLDYWQENDFILPNKYNADASSEPVSLPQLLKRKTTLRTYISKLKHKPEKQTKLQDYKNELAAVELAIKQYD